MVPVEGETNIALYHGAVVGSKTDFDWNILKTKIPDTKAHFAYGLNDPYIKKTHIEQFLETLKIKEYIELVKYPAFFVIFSEMLRFDLIKRLSTV